MIKSQARPREGAGTRGKSVIADEPVSHYCGRRGLVASNPQESVPALSICTVRDRARARVGKLGVVLGTEECRP
jgi:hypothetical protein